MKVICQERDTLSGYPKKTYFVRGDRAGLDVFICMLKLSVWFSDREYYKTDLDEKYTDAEIMAMFGNRKMRKEPYFTQIV